MDGNEQHQRNAQHRQRCETMTDGVAPTPAEEGVGDRRNRQNRVMAMLSRVYRRHRGDVMGHHDSLFGFAVQTLHVTCLSFFGSVINIFKTTIVANPTTHEPIPQTDS